MLPRGVASMGGGRGGGADAGAADVEGKDGSAAAFGGSRIAGRQEDGKEDGMVRDQD